MEIAGYIIYGVGVLLATVWLVGIRLHTNSGQGVTMSTVNITMLFIVSLVLVPIIKLEPLHLLWMYPSSFLIGTLSLMFPFSLLSIPGNLLAKIACVGLDQSEIAIKKERINKMRELILSENITAEEAKEKLKKNGEW